MHLAIPSISYYQNSYRLTTISFEEHKNYKFSSLTSPVLLEHPSQATPPPPSVSYDHRLPNITVCFAVTYTLSNGENIMGTFGIKMASMLGNHHDQFFLRYIIFDL